MSGNESVKAWEEKVKIPTYVIGEPEKYPMFFEKRVYQGSSGRVYPYPIVDKVYDRKRNKTYNALFLENKYIRMMVLPELGGRIQYAYDKTNNYAFIYHNKVIKPALVGLTGPWISGGIEFNWPQHHRPSTFEPVSYSLEENKDGSKSLILSEIERMSRLKENHRITLYPDKSYIEISVQLFNPNPVPKTFLWWANPAVSVNEYYQSVFPPDVHFVADHGKRDISRFPIATGTYYDIDYSPGVDISWYKNIPTPASYMALSSKFDFVGGYDHAAQAGVLHVADHHISPGKKMWTWGTGDFGKAWERNLTESDGPYVELMTGVFTDNQPDFSWLQAYETKTFRQYFYPFKKIGGVTKANIDFAVNLREKDGKFFLGVYSTAEEKSVTIVVSSGDDRLLRVDVDEISPYKPYVVYIDHKGSTNIHDLTLSLQSEDGKELLSYSPEPVKDEKFPEPAKEAPPPESIASVNELYLTGLHLEQYRHATFEPEDYYLEALRRDPNDVRSNNAYGLLQYQRGDFKKAEIYFRRAIESATRKNPNPYDGEIFYNLGLSLFIQDRKDEAYDAFYKATWNRALTSPAFYYLAITELDKGNSIEAHEFIEKSLLSDPQNNASRNVECMILRKSSKYKQAISKANNAILDDPFNFCAYNELKLALKVSGDEKEAEKINSRLKEIMNGNVHNYLELSIEYIRAGLLDEASDVLNDFISSNNDRSSINPMVFYFLGFMANKKNENALAFIKKAENQPFDYCFPHRLESIPVLSLAMEINPDGAKAPYYLGNLFYDKKQYEKAIELWEKSVNLDDAFPVVHRNLSIAYYNKRCDEHLAAESMVKASELDNDNARVLFELDQLDKKTGVSPEIRMKRLREHWNLVESRDDLYLEFVALENLSGNYDKALHLLKNHSFHPWEGGEGKVTGQYIFACVQLGRNYLESGLPDKAMEYLEMARNYPENLGEGKLTGTRENYIFYYLAKAYEISGDLEKSLSYFEKAATGNYQPSMSMYYYDKASDMIFYQGLALQKLGKSSEARSKFHQLIDYGEKHLFDEVKIDYFAISLPDFLVFDEDLQKKNQVNCQYLMGLGLFGLGYYREAGERFNNVLILDSNHTPSRIMSEMTLVNSLQR